MQKVNFRLIIAWMGFLHFFVKLDTFIVIYSLTYIENETRI